LPELPEVSEHIVNHLSGVDRNMGGLINAVGAYGLVLEGHCHPYESLAQAITHQQLHAAAARSILSRFVSTFGNGAFPTPETVIATPSEALRAVGLSFSKIAALKDLATKTAEGVVPDRATLVSLADEEIIARLTQVRGIGRWTVEMLLMFQLGRPDILPVDDFGVRFGFQATYGLRKMPAPKVLAAYGERWGPHRSAAAWYLWRAVELKRGGTLPAPLEQIRLPRMLRVRRRRADSGAGAKGKVAKRTRVNAKGKAKRVSGPLPASRAERTSGSSPASKPARAQIAKSAKAISKKTSSRKQAPTNEPSPKKAKPTRGRK
jgi:DNA-3-methyladenine glycosylase II